MNAGAWGGETWEYVREVETLDRHGTIRRRRPQDYEVSYRSVRGPEGEWFTAATFVFRPGGDPVGLSERVRELLAQRGRTQPTGQASCGSVFRNPTGDHAARLIEATGLKGECIGGACVSEKHANFIINTGDATAADIEALIRLVQERVEAAQGVRLQPEVRIVGEVESNE
jgi:UDP-N-acetylmuramate dehydrogenase